MSKIILQMKKKKRWKKYDPSNLFMKSYKYGEWYKKDHSQKNLLLKE